MYVSNKLINCYSPRGAIGYSVFSYSHSVFSYSHSVFSYNVVHISYNVVTSAIMESTSSHQNRAGYNPSMPDYMDL